MSSVGGNSKLSLIECKKILNKEADEYTDEQVIKIRDWLYHIADIAIEAYEIEKEKCISLPICNKNKDKL
jgi:hypothetical protein